MKRFFVGAAALLVIAGCNSDNPLRSRHVPCNPLLLEFAEAPSDTIAVRGIKYIELQAGTGAIVESNHFVEVNYSGYLLDGTRFDSSCPSNRETLRVRVGLGGAIAGFERGLIGMRAGGVRRVIIPPELAYGDRALRGIPPNSTLVFDIEVVGFVR